MCREGLGPHSTLAPFLGDGTPGPTGAFPTFVLVEEAAYQGQNGQCDEVSQAGCNGRSDVIRVDPELPSTNHYADH